MNAKNYVVFPYTKNKLAEREIKKKILFMIASKRIKYLGINLTEGKSPWKLWDIEKRNLRWHK